jgi:uncharacterized protein YndB with AHSA1/START domain
MSNIREQLPALLRRGARAALKGAAFTFALSHSSNVAAEVVASGPNGFSLSETAHIAASPDKVYAAIVAPSHWWSSQHSFSGSAANFTLDTKEGGCWCETLPNGGFVEHLRVVYAAPGKALRLRGALGPFQGWGADGAMTYTLKGDDKSTDLTLTYNLGGFNKDGFDAASKGADGVLAEAAMRLKSYVETGSPEPAKTN